MLRFTYQKIYQSLFSRFSRKRVFHADKQTFKEFSQTLLVPVVPFEEGKAYSLL